VTNQTPQLSEDLAGGGVRVASTKMSISNIEFAPGKHLNHCINKLLILCFKQFHLKFEVSSLSSLDTPLPSLSDSLSVSGSDSGWLADASATSR
jgi:hypothetical protein